MTTISTHVLNTALGRPAVGISVTLEAQIAPGEWTGLAQADTDVDGRVRGAIPPAPPGVYRLRFDTSTLTPFYPEVIVVFRIDPEETHYHVPLLISPYGYSTYRGS